MAKTEVKSEKQIKAFRKAARELGCEDNEERFRSALRTIASAKPSAEKRKVRRTEQREGKQHQE